MYDLVDTTGGHLALVELFGQRAGIYTTGGDLKTPLHIPGRPLLRDIARQGRILFITDSESNIHLLHDNGTYLRSVTSGIKRAYGLAVSDSTFWVTTFTEGVHALTFDSDYVITARETFLPPDSDCMEPAGVAVMGDSVALACSLSHTVNLYTKAASPALPPLGGWGDKDGQLQNPMDVAMDTQGRIYVADSYNQRVVFYSGAGVFLGSLVSHNDGLRGNPVGLFVSNQKLYVTTTEPNRLYVVHLN